MHYNSRVGTNKATEEIHKKLMEFAKVFDSGTSNALGEYHFPNQLIKWFNSICKDKCGFDLNDSFNAQTLLSNMQNRKEGALFKFNFRADRNKINEYQTDYMLALETYNTEADTDMSDEILMSIDFKIIKVGEKRNSIITEYSFTFHS